VTSEVAKYPNLKAEINRRGMTFAEFAKSVGVSEKTVSNWINGNSAPSIDKAREISQAMSAPIDYLFALEPITPSA